MGRKAAPVQALRNHLKELGWIHWSGFAAHRG